MTATRTAAPKPRGRPRKVPAAVGHELLPGTEVPEEPMTVNGLAVVETHRLQNLPGVPMNLLKLTLEDGSSKYQCIDCPEVIGTRDEVRLHRRNTHNHKTKSHAKTAAPSPVLHLPIGQILEMAESSLSAGALVERVEAERDRAKTELAEMTRKYTSLIRALDRAGFMPKMEDEQ